MLVGHSKHIILQSQCFGAFLEALFFDLETLRAHSAPCRDLPIFTCFHSQHAPLLFSLVKSQYLITTLFWFRSSWNHAVVNETCTLRYMYRHICKEKNNTAFSDCSFRV